MPRKRRAQPPAIFDDELYFVLDARLTSGGVYLSRFLKLKQTEETAFNYPPDFNKPRNVHRLVKDRIRKKRYCAVTRTELDDGENSEGKKTVKSMNRKAFEEIFSLNSNIDPNQVIVDVVLQQIVISTTMCYELCWLYLPTFDRRRIRRRRKKIAGEIFSTLSKHYTGFSFEDVTQAIAFLIGLARLEEKRGLNEEQIFSDGKRKEIFEARSRYYRFLKKFNVGFHELCRYLLRGGNPSELDVNSAIGELMQNRSWTISETTRSVPTLLLEWRRILLTRDWSCLVNSLTRGRKRLEFYEYDLPKGIFCANLRRVLMELVRFSYFDKTKSANGLIGAMDKTIRTAPYVKKSVDHILRNLETALWHLGTNQLNEGARDQFSNIIAYSKIRRRRAALAASTEMIKTTYEGLYLFYEIVSQGVDIGTENSNFTISKIMRVLRANILNLRGVSCLFNCIISILHRSKRDEEAAELVEEYLQMYPDDIYVYETAVNRLKPQYAAIFASQLTAKVAWHPVVIDWAQYEIKRPDEEGNPALVANRLMQFLDYGKNKDKTDAWTSLALALSAVKGEEQVKTIREAWKERRTWWKKFHGRRNGSDEKLEELKRRVLKKLKKLAVAYVGANLNLNL